MAPAFIAAAVLEEARIFFEDRGSFGLEGTAMIAGRDGGIGDRLVIPNQIAEREDGCRVEVTAKGKLELTAAIRDGSIYHARIHSHPGDAFHSRTDDRNPILTYEGALSIVVPFFGLGLRRGLDACAVYVLRGQSWVALQVGTSRDYVVRVE